MFGRILGNTLIALSLLGAAPAFAQGAEGAAAPTAPAAAGRPEITAWDTCGCAGDRDKKTEGSHRGTENTEKGVLCVSV